MEGFWTWGKRFRVRGLRKGKLSLSVEECPACAGLRGLV